MHKQVITVIVLVVMATVGALVAWASDFTADQLVQVSNTSPFDDACGLATGGGTLFPDSEVEPWVEVNPDDPTNIVGGWQQDRWSNGGARGLLAGISSDGGASWEKVVIPGITECSGGEFQRASDPWVTFAPNGDVYFMSLVFDIDTPPGRTGGFGPNGMAINKSIDGGQSWGDPVILIRDDNPRFLNDKNSMTADPTDEDGDLVYAVWDRLQLPVGTVINPERVFGFGFKGPAYLARTTNGGETWEPARKIYDPGANNQTIGNQIVVLPDGTVVDFFNEILSFKNSDGGTKFDFNLSLIRSTDQGQTWKPKGKAIRAAKMQSLALVRPFGVVNPEEPAEGVRTGDILPEVAAGPEGNLYAVWQDARFSNFQFDSVAFAQSTDGGFTWSSPVKINKTPENIAPGNQQAFTPAIRVGADGTIAVTYYDFRNNDGGADLKTDYFIVHCHAGCTDPANWTETQLTAASFDMRQAPLARGFFTGDYEGLGTDGTDFAAFFSQPHGSDPSSVFFGRVGGP